MLLSFIIVNYNSKDLIKKALDDIKNSIENSEFEIIIVDNNSIDGSKDYFTNLMKNERKLKYIYLDNNYGFGKANNIGVKNSKGDILIFINPDIEIRIKGFDKFIIENLNDNIGILAPKIIYPDGSIQPNSQTYSTFYKYIFQSLKLGYISRKFNLVKIFKKIFNIFPFMKKGLIGNYLLNYENKDIIECDWVSGACFILRKELFEKVGGFDENFFMYAEDEDLCRRIKKLGFKIIVNNSFYIIHLEGGTQKRNSKNLSKSIKERYKSDIYYYYKYNGYFKALLLKLLYLKIILLKSIFFLFTFKIKLYIDYKIFFIELFKYKFNLIKNS